MLMSLRAQQADFNGSDEMIKKLFNFFFLTLPLTLGIIFILTALSFLVEFSSHPSLHYLLEEEYVGFVLFAMTGIPLCLYGITLLSHDENQD